MVRTAAKVFGAVFILIGIMGFIPAFTPDSHLLGLFHVNTLHNIIHLASGVVALVAGYGSLKASRLYFQVFAVIYGLVTILGFIYGDKDILGVVASNMADTVLHIFITLGAAYFGFVAKDRDGAQV